MVKHSPLHPCKQGKSHHHTQLLKTLRHIPTFLHLSERCCKPSCQCSLHLFTLVHKEEVLETQFGISTFLHFHTGSGNLVQYLHLFTPLHGKQRPSLVSPPSYTFLQEAETQFSTSTFLYLHTGSRNLVWYLHLLAPALRKVVMVVFPCLQTFGVKI